MGGGANHPIFFLLGSSLTPSSDSHQSPSPRKGTPPHTPGDSAHQAETEAAVPPPASPDVQQAAFPEVSPTGYQLKSPLTPAFPITRPRPLYWTPASFAPEPSSPKSGPHGPGPPGRLGRAVRRVRKPRIGSSVTPQVREPSPPRPTGSLSFAAVSQREPVSLCLTETKASRKDSDSEEPRGAEGGPAASSQPARVALFPGVDASVLKVSVSHVRLCPGGRVLLKRVPRRLS